MGKRKIKIKSKHKTLKSQCDRIWSEIIKLRAGFKSEMSGKEGKQRGGEFVLQAHHEMGKNTYAMRYNLDGGFCLTRSEHLYFAHAHHKREEFREFVKSARGDDFYEKLSKFKHKISTPLWAYKAFLEQELEKLKNKMNGHKW